MFQLKVAITMIIAAWAAVQVFHALEHLPTAVAWIGVCFAVLGAGIGALIARHENNLEKEAK